MLDIYDISIEILQNMLKYSYGNKVDESKKREADGKFSLIYSTVTGKTTLHACNLVSASQQEVIRQRIDEVDGLDERALKKLIRTKMKTGKDRHMYGAGLGFATIALKTSEPLDVRFEEVLDNVVKYRLVAVV